MKLTFVKKLALDKFLRRIDDIILRDEMLDLFKKIGRQGNPTVDDLKRTKEILDRANIPYKDFEELRKVFKR